jgi:hypothetical protein
VLLSLWILLQEVSPQTLSGTAAQVQSQFLMHFPELSLVAEHRWYSPHGGAVLQVVLQSHSMTQAPEASVAPTHFPPTPQLPQVTPGLHPKVPQLHVGGVAGRHPIRQ